MLLRLEFAQMTKKSELVIVVFVDGGVICILHSRFLSISGIEVIGVQCEPMGVKHTVL